MAAKGWTRLLADAEWCRGAGNFTLRAYSEFMPAPRLGIKPSGAPTVAARDPGDEWGWQISPYEQAHELEPGIALIAREILKEVVNLGHGRPCPQIQFQVGNGFVLGGQHRDAELHDDPSAALNRGQVGDSRWDVG